MTRRSLWLAFVGTALVATTAIAFVIRSPYSEWGDETTVVGPGIASFIATGIAVTSSARTFGRAVLRAVGVLAVYALLLYLMIFGLPWQLLHPGGSSDSHEVLLELAWQDCVIVAAALALPLWAVAGRAARRADLPARRLLATAIALVPVVACIVGSASSSLLGTVLWLGSVLWLTLVLTTARTRAASAPGPRPVVE